MPVSKPTVAKAIPSRALAGVPPRSPAPVPKLQPFKIRAIQVGYYDHVRRRVGDVFLVADAQAFSRVWMARVAPDTPERVTTGAQALRKQHDEILGGQVLGRQDDATGAEDVFGK